MLCYSLLVTRCKITRCSLQNLLDTRCRSCSLQKVTRYSLQKLLVAKNHSSLVQKFARYSLQKFTRYSLRKLLVSKNHLLLAVKNCSLLTANFDRYLESLTTAISVKFSYGRQNLNEFGSIYWIFYINKNHVLPHKTLD